MTAISSSTVGQSTRMSSLLRSLRSEMSTAEIQVTSGLKSQTFSGLGTDASTSISLRGDLNRLDAYVSNINTALGNTEVMNTALENIASLAGDVLTTMIGQTQGSDAVSESVNISAGNALDSIQNLLNTSLNGRLLFTGDAVQNAPVQDTEASDSFVQAEIAAWQAGTQDADTTIANINAMTNADMGLSADLETAGGLTVRVDDDLTVDYTVKADNESFTNIIKGLSLIANLEFNSDDVEGYWTLYNSAMNMLDQGCSDLDIDIANLGLSANSMESASERHAETEVVMQTMISEVEDVDVAEVLTKLQNMQTQLEISYRIIASMQETSLVDYL